MYKSRLMAELVEFTSPAGLNIKGFNAKLCDSLIESGLVNDVTDIFNITADLLVDEEIVKNHTRAHMLEMSIGRATVVSVESLFRVLKIKGLTHTLLSHVCKTDFEDKQHTDLSLQDWLTVKDITKEQATELYNWFNEKDNIALYKKLRKVLIIETCAPKRLSDSLVGQRWMISGGAEGYTRYDIERLIVQNGGVVLDDYNDTVTHCYVGVKPSDVIHKCLANDVTIVEHNVTGSNFLLSLELDIGQD